MREYGATNGQMENLLKDAVLRNRIGTLEVKITNLSPGTYNLTTFHNPGGTCCCGGCFPVQAFSSSTLLAPQYVKMVNRLTLEDAPQAHWNQLVVGSRGKPRKLFDRSRGDDDRSRDPLGPPEAKNSPHHGWGVARGRRRNFEF